jgi:hypothetical protein
MNTMKKQNIWRKAPVVILIMFILSSCVDVLDVVPTDKISIDRILKKNNVQNFRTNSYGHLNNTFQDHFAGQLPETYTDDAFRAGTGITFDWHAGLLSPQNNMFASTMWNNYWQGIRKSNLAIEYLPQSTVSEDIISEDELAMWYEEVVVLRAWYHFQLVKAFGPVPFVEEAFEPDFVGWAELTRPTYDEIATKIVEELDGVIAKGLLPLRWEVNSDYGFVNMAMVHALKSRVLLYNASLLNNSSNDQAKWQKAAAAAQACLNEIVPEYQLVSIEQYGNMFLEAVTVASQEILLRAGDNGAAVMNNANGIDLAAYGSAKQSANCGAVPTQELIDCFELLNGSIPVSYNNADHTSVSFAAGYSEAPGSDPYANRDARLAHSVVYNGAKYGKYKGMAASAPELTIFTYLGKEGTGFNDSPTSQEEADQRRSATGYYASKYRSAGYWGSVAGGTNAQKVYFRLAEVYLNLAEAECELGKLDEAIVALDVVRTRAMQPGLEAVPGFAKTKEFIMERIRNERRIELCFEGHRFFDQRRWKILNETNGAINGMKITSSDGSDGGEFSYQRVKIDVARTASTEKYLVLPLPSEEARRLTGLGQPAAWQ